MTRRPAFHLAVLLVCLAVIAAACGSRLSEQEILAKNASGGSGRSAAAGRVDAGQSGSTAGDQQAGPGAGPSGVATGASGTAGAASAQGAVAAGPTPGGSSSSGGGGTGVIKIGFIGALSGAAGVTVSSARDGWVVWSKMINGKGGINGHPVQVLVGDDGTNDARGVAIARDFVENQGAIALSWSSNDIHGLASYALQKRIPLIGVVEGQDVWGTNPMLFSATSGSAGGWNVVRAAKDVGATKIAVLYCVEAATCQTGADSMSPYAAPEGVKIVYKAGVSLTQPDFTAECLQARDSGAQGVVLLVDQNSVLRFMQSCLRQGYHPVPIGTSSDASAKQPELEGLVSASSNFPWFVRSGAPGVDEYVQALQKYAPNLLTDGSAFQSLSWVAAKVFQSAVENATKTNNPAHLTNEDLLNGLWAMNGDTLDGLAQGGEARTYRRDQPSPPTYCVFIGRLQSGKWSMMTGPGITPQCR